MTDIECYFSVMSPYSYLAMGRLAQIAAQRGAVIQYLPLHFASLAARMGGVVMTEASGPRKIWFAQDLARQAAKLALPLTPKPAFWPANSAPASYAIISAQRAGEGDLHGLVQGFCRAVWAEDRNIADDDVVRNVMAAHGFDPAIADRGMFTAAQVYEDNLEQAAVKGVFGVPFMIVGADRFWGQDRLDDLDQHLAQL
jgi:2-hydroxychromene-2-carboxylate isomerase